MAFVDLSSLGLASTPQQLYALWLAYMQAQYSGYNPADANPENVQALAIAEIGADVAQTAVVVPDAIFRAYGTKLANLPYEPGVAATASVQITALDTAGYTLPAGTSVTLGNFGFQTLADLAIPNGSSTGTVTVLASTPSVAYNGATNPVELLSVVNWVSSITALAPASGGVDPEDDVDYQNRLAALLKLQAPRPITASDYATMSLSFSPAAGTDQQEIGRATAIDGYVKGAASFTVTTVNANATATVTASPGTGITAAQGATITGTNIPAGTIVLSSSAGSIVMSKNATGSGSGITATVGGTLGNERSQTVGVALADGTATNADTKTALAAWLKSFREVNFAVSAIDPTYTPVYVDVTVKLYAGFDPTASQTAIQAAIINFLSPASFNLPSAGDATAWLSGTTIYYSRLLAIIQNAAGGAVDHVVGGTLTLGTASTPTGVVDLVLPGPIALPTSTTGTVVVTIA